MLVEEKGWASFQGDGQSRGGWGPYAVELSSKMGTGGGGSLHVERLRACGVLRDTFHKVHETGEQRAGHSAWI